MRKLLVVILVIVLKGPVAFAESVDLSGLSFDDLVALRDRINLAIWQSDEWQEVTVPQGVWRVGEDIPAGHWMIKAAEGVMSLIAYGDILSESNEVSGYSNVFINRAVNSETYRSYNVNEDMVQFDIDMKDGFFVEILYGSAVFMPYAGKPSLGFK